jgi:glycosyltransferase involved in cell wall biosynthesis
LLKQFQNRLMHQPPMPPEPTSQNLCLYYAGLWVEEELKAELLGFSISGNNLQKRFLDTLQDIGLGAHRIYSLRPARSYPRQNLLWRGDRKNDGTGHSIYYLPFVNWGPLKMLTQGAAFLVAFLVDRVRGRKMGCAPVLISYNLSHPQGLFLWLAAWITRTKWVVFLADFPGVASSHGNGIARKISFFLEKTFVRLADSLILLNPNLVADYHLRLPYLNIIPAPPQEVMDQLFLLPIKSERSRSILYAGSLDETRGVGNLLKAIQLLDHGLNIKVIIAGKGHLLSDVEAAARHDARIVYAGCLSQQELFAMYRTAGALINPHLTSTLESRSVFPNKVIEYFASGTPVITSRVANIDTHFPAQAIYLDSDSPEDIAKGMVTFVEASEESLWAMAESARSILSSGELFRRQQNELRAFLCDAAFGKKVAG